MEIGESVRQGDVLLIRVKELPIGYDKFPTDRCVIALGEASGHEHVIEKNVELWVNQNQAWLTGSGFRPSHDPTLNRYLKITGKTSLDHVKAFRPTGDHDFIELDPGEYKVVIQRHESAPAQKSSPARYVED
jgi:hypothetical protein